MDKKDEVKNLLTTEKEDLDNNYAEKVSKLLGVNFEVAGVGMNRQTFINEYSELLGATATEIKESVKKEDKIQFKMIPFYIQITDALDDGETVVIPKVSGPRGLV